MILVLLLANLVHGLVGLAWIAGLRGLCKPLPVRLWTSLISLALALPPLVAIARILGAPQPPADARLVRADPWADLLRDSHPVLQIVLGVLLIGTTLIFVVQELGPVLRWRRRRFTAPHVADDRLETAYARVCAGSRAVAEGGRLAKRTKVACLESEETIAALHGVVRPTVVISRGLMQRLDDEELDGVIAHELAHVVYGGNARLLVMWLLRALQAWNPAALLLFRSLVEVREESCDELAARITRKPAALASALLKVYGRGHSVPRAGSAARRAHMELVRRADAQATHMRVRVLLDHSGSGAAPRSLVWLSFVVLGGMLWAIS